MDILHVTTFASLSSLFKWTLARKAKQWLRMGKNGVILLLKQVYGLIIVVAQRKEGDWEGKCGRVGVLYFAVCQFIWRSHR
jgi:hypothetical protein